MKRKAGWIKWLAGTILLLGVCLYLEGHRLGLTTASQDLDEQLRLAKQEGIPIVPEDIQHDSVSDDQNAANLLANADLTAKSLVGNPLETAYDWSSTPYGTKKPTEAAVKSALAELEPVFHMLEEASQRPHLDEHYQWSLGNRLTFPELSSTKRLVRALLVKAEFADKTGHLDQAFQCLECAARLANLHSEELMVIGLFVHVSLDALLTRAVEDFVRRHGSDFAALEKARKILDALGPMPDMLRASKSGLVAARLMIREMPYYNEKHQADDSFGDPAWVLMRVKSVSDLNEANLIRHFRENYKALPSGPEDVERAKREMERVDIELSKNQDKNRLAYMGTELSFFPSINTLNIWMNDLCRRRTLLAGIDILEEKIKTGSFPTRWSKKGQDGLDPYPNRPLSYARTQKGFVVYSFGQDLQDDGGRPYTLDEDSGHRFDISFEYPVRRVKPISVVKSPGPSGSSKSSD